MLIRLPTKKHLKAWALVNDARKQRSLSLREIQMITGYLNFVTTVTPLGRTFLRRLYNMEVYFRTGNPHHRRRISAETKRDLVWCSKALSEAPERSIADTKGNIMRVWSDAASTNGLGAFYLSPNQHKPDPDAAFCIPLPRSVATPREHINTTEMRGVEQVLLHWRSKWRGKRLVMHIDNKAVVHDLRNQTIRGGSIPLLRRCLLLATEYDLHFEARWISTKENALADVLSSLEYYRIADLAPQLLQPASSLLLRGFQTYSNRNFHTEQPTTCGGG